MQDAFDDLSTRFIMNCPAEEFQSFERLFFQLEQAHWFYEDFLREKDGRLPGYSLKDFCAQFFEYCPLLQAYRGNFDQNYTKFHSYKIRVPVCGAILFNSDLTQVVLVRGWSRNAGWGFPKGKINKNEPERECAIREVLEETGFDCRPYLGGESDFLEVRVQTQTIRLFVATGVPDDSIFETQTRKEIGKISWFKLNEIPHNNSFFMVVPFLPLIKNWVKARKKAMRSNGSEWLGLQASPKASRSKKGNRQQQQQQQQQETFGSAHGTWSAEEMFRTNEQLFGVTTDYNFENYTTPLPLHERARPAGTHHGNFQPPVVQPAAGKQISLMHLLQPSVDPAKENSAMPPPPNRNQPWQAWNIQEMQRAQCQAVGTPSSMSAGINFSSTVPSSSLPTTPELYAHPGFRTVPCILDLSASQSQATTATNSARSCSTETSSSTDAKFHFDKSKILGAMIF